MYFKLASNEIETKSSVMSDQNKYDNLHKRIKGC